MLALLALIPIKDWIYTGLIAVILAVGGYEWHKHDVEEQAKGAAAILASDRKAAAEEAGIVAEDKLHEQEAIAQAVAAFQATVALPPPPAPTLVCVDPARRSGNVPNNGGTSRASNGESAVPAESDVPFNPAPAVIADGRDADAQVKLLQAYIAECQREGICLK